LTKFKHIIVGYRGTHDANVTWQWKRERGGRGGERKREKKCLGECFLKAVK